MSDPVDEQPSCCNMQLVSMLILQSVSKKSPDEINGSFISQWQFKKEKLVEIKEIQVTCKALADFLAGLIIFEHVYGSKIRWSGP